MPGDKYYEENAAWKGEGIQGWLFEAEQTK